MVPDARGTMKDSRNDSRDFASDTLNPNYTVNDVSVIMDVDMEDYHFTTQPGAFRRVVMNLIGNALKYTSHGFVSLKLRTTALEDLPIPGSSESISRSLVHLTVLDTGKGISSDFLRSKLFTPFAQENSLSSGTGLGLSIVRSIVNLLEGEISIDSEVNEKKDHVEFQNVLRGCCLEHRTSSQDMFYLLATPRRLKNLLLTRRLGGPRDP